MITFGFKNKFSGLLRAIAAILIGVIMVSMPATSLIIVVKILAAVLIASGIVSLVYGIIHRENGGLLLLGFNTVVDILLGILLFIFPAEVANFMIILIGALLMVSGIFQILALVSASGFVRLGFYSFILPVLCAGGGLLLLFRPFETASTLTLVAGIVVLVYGVSELVATWKMNRAMKEYEVKFPGSGSSEGETLKYDDIKDAEYEKVDDSQGKN